MEQVALPAYKRLRFERERLQHYRFLVPAKMFRALAGYSSALEEEDLYDVNGTAKFLYECLGRVNDSLWFIGEFHRPWLDRALPLCMETENLRREVDRRFPGHRLFRRPGFDDESSRP